MYNELVRIGTMYDLLISFFWLKFIWHEKWSFFQVLFNDHYILIRFCIGNKWINKMFHFITAFGDSLSWKRNKLPKTTRSQQNDTTTEADCKLSERIKNCETFSGFFFFLFFFVFFVFLWVNSYSVLTFLYYQ